MLNKNNLNKTRFSILKKKLEEKVSFKPEEIMNNLDKINDSNSSLLKEINEEKNLFLDELIIEFFENKFLMFFNCIKKLKEKTKEKLFPKYFQDSKSDNLTIFDLSLILFKQAISFLDKISTTNTDYINIGKLYSITYVKLYLFKLIGFTKIDFNTIDQYKEIFQNINNIKNKNFKKVVLIYILKLYYYYLNNDFGLLKNLYEMKLYNIFDNDLSILFKDNDTIVTNYYVFPLEKDKYEKYSQKLKEFENMKRDKFNDETKIKNFIINSLDNQKLDIFIIISINKIFFNIYPNCDEIKVEEFFIFIKIANSLINDYFHENQELKKLLNLFYDREIFLKNVFPQIKDKKILEILLYGFRFCVKSLNHEKKNFAENKLNNENKEEEKYFYKSLISKNVIESIEDNYIPGIDNQEYLHLVTLETIITHLNTKPDRHGCYVCSCGYYYDIDPCGFPTKNRTFDCPVCGLKIGWGPKPVKVGEETHGMVIRPGHLRIFKDEKAKKYQMRVFDEVDENIPNMLLDDYIKNVIEPLQNKNNIGIGECSKNYFLKTNKSIRNLSQIGYRLLNYIFYCHLFFGYSIGNISEMDLKQYLVKNMSIINIIEANWNLLKDSLQEGNINSIHIFMNIIFDDISDLVQECKYLEKPEEREQFENEIEKMISKYLDKYDEYSDKYIEENKKQIKFDDYYNIETIITELIPITEDIYNQKEYPLFKYFILTTYKSKLDCLNHIPDANKYSLTYQLLKEKPEYSFMKYLPSFNNFINYMNKTYSFKITREEAHQRKLNEEKIFTSNEFIEKFNNFREIWNIIKPYVKKYKCSPELPIKELDSNDYLSYFLNDNSEFGYGMYIAAACQCFIDWQNSFLDNILENNLSEGCILYKYIDHLKNKIGVNEADDRQILLIEEKFEKSEFKNIEDIIYTYSERDMLKNGKINYQEYNNFKYNYDKIEEELGKIILPGLQLFKGEDDLELVIYWGEGFKGKRTSTLIEFCSKYPQQNLTLKEKSKIINYLKEKIKKENSSLNDVKVRNGIIKQFFGLSQKLILYLTTITSININTPILSIIKPLSSENEFPDIFIEFFTLIKEEIKIDKFLSIYIILEHLCFNDLKSLLKNEFKKEIDEYKMNNIIKRFECKNNLYSKKDLAIALRRLITRYLIGTGDINDIKPENDLCSELSREDLWDDKIKKIDDLDLKIKDDFGDFKLKVNQAYNLYELIGKEDKKEIENFFE